MTGTMALRAQKATKGSAVSGLQYPEVGSIQESLVECVRGIFPRKTWAYLATLIGSDERVAKHRLASSRRFTAEEVALMLRSEHGMAVLATLMGEATPAWWLSVRKAFDLGAKRRHLSNLKEAIDAYAQCEDALSRAETSLRISDADFHREDIAALRASRGNLRGAMAR